MFVSGTKTKTEKNAGRNLFESFILSKTYLLLKTFFKKITNLDKNYYTDPYK